MRQFAENESFEHLFQPRYDDIIQGFELKGKWHSDYFGNNNPIVLEMGCGKGEYTLGLAKKYPEKNFIGLDLKGARIWRGCKSSIEEELHNVAFLRTAGEFIEFMFDRGEVSEIWITFPEPHPQKAKSKKRFTSPQFNERYKNILKPNGIIHLKTDIPEFLQFSLDTIAAGNHKLLVTYKELYKEDPDDEVKEIQTFYENIWLREGRTISYLRYQLNPSLFQGPYIISTDLSTESFRSKKA